MPNKIPCIIFTGTSGAGKSTLMHRCVADTWGDRTTAILPKLTTRRLRGDSDSREVTSVDVPTILQMKNDGRLTAYYEGGGVHYGIPRVEAGDTREVLFQCSTPIGVDMVRESGVYAVYSCLLRLDPNTARSRILQRGGSIDASSIEERINHGRKVNASTADFIVDAKQSPNAVYQQVRAWILGILELPSSAALYAALQAAMHEAEGMDDERDIAIANYFLARAALMEVNDSDQPFYGWIETLFTKACHKLQRLERGKNPLLQKSDDPEFIQGAEAARGSIYRFLFSQSAD